MTTIIKKSVAATCIGIIAMLSAIPSYATMHRHSYTVKQRTVAPTCTTKGYTLYKCRKCSSTTKKNSKPALGHSYSIRQKTVNPTCTLPGYTQYKCRRCAATTKLNKKPALGHNFGKAGCTHPQQCQRKGCKATKGRALGHQLVNMTYERERSIYTVCIRGADCDYGMKLVKRAKSAKEWEVLKKRYDTGYEISDFE